MFSIGLRLRATFSFLGAIALVLVFAATAAWAIESEGDLFSRSRVEGNLGVAHADVGVYPDRADVNPAPVRTTGSDTLSVPADAEIVESLVYWAGRGPGWSQDSIVVNGVTVTADIDYSWDGPGFVQTTYVADLAAAGVTFTPGTNAVDVSGFVQDNPTDRAYGAGVVVIYEDSSLPEVELALFEGNEFAFFLDPFSNEVGESAEHTNVSCVEFAPSIEDRTVNSFTRIMGVDAGRSDAPPRSQRIQWWQGTAPVVAPVVDGVVGIPSAAPSGSVDNPVPTKVDPNGSWGSVVFEEDINLAAGNTHLCTQVQSVSLGDGAGASLSVTNQGGSTDTVHSLGNLVFLDNNGDGMADADDSGIEGVIVELLKDGELIATTITNADGEYEFEGLLCGTYKVVVPGGQGDLAVDGEAIDAASIIPGSVSNPNANDDNDNDNNGVVSGDMVMSGEIEIGDCGEDGDFSNSASNEPTDETDRKEGADIDDGSGAIPDERSNDSVDIGFISHECVEQADGTFPAGAVNPDGEACTECDTADPGPAAVDADGEPCNPPCGDDAPAGAVDADGEPCNPPCGDDAAADAVDADGEPCNPLCGDDAAAAAGVDADGNPCNPCGDNAGADAVNQDGEPCNPPPCGDDAAADAVDADGEPCNDGEEVPVEVLGEVECGDDTDNPGTTVPAGESCNNVCDEDGNVVAADVAGATEGNCQETQVPGDAGEITVEVLGEVECGDDTDKAGTTVPAGESCNNVCDEDGNVVAADVAGATEENCDDEEVIEVEVLQETETAPNLAVTGAWSTLVALAALMVAVLGTWFYVASLWFRPAEARRF